MKAIEITHGPFIILEVGKRYYIDRVRDLSGEFVGYRDPVNHQGIVLKELRGNTGAYFINDDGTISFKYSYGFFPVEP